jgi:hypothetical protein
MEANAFYSDSLASARVEEASVGAKDPEQSPSSLRLEEKFKMGQCSISARMTAFKGSVDDRVTDEDSIRAPGAVPKSCK